MKEKEERIKRMVAEGKVSEEEGKKLLDALKESEAKATQAAEEAGLKVKTSKWAVISLILGISSIFMGVLLGILAIIFGWLGLKEIERERLEGKDLAKAGIITGTIGTVLSLLLTLGSLFIFVSLGITFKSIVSLGILGILLSGLVILSTLLLYAPLMKMGMRKGTVICLIIGISMFVGGPILGLGGTIMGMIDAFNTIGQINSPPPSELARGVYTALYSSGGGFAVAGIGFVLSLGSLITHFVMKQRSSRL